MEAAPQSKHIHEAGVLILPGGEVRQGIWQLETFWFIGNALTPHWI